MNYEFRMKTGFFETKAYDLLIHEGKLFFSPKESDEGLITVPKENILTITLKKGRKLFEMEVQTDEKNYHGLLDNNTDCEELINQLKVNINKKILCEL